MFILGVLIIIVLVLFYIYVKWTYQYWQRKNCPTLPGSFPWGQFQNVFTGPDHIGLQFRDVYNEVKRKRGWKYCGLYMILNRRLLLTDLDLVKLVMTKEFQHFTDRDMYMNDEDPLSANLFNLGGSRWKSLRVKLTPTFTSGKIKNMFQTVVATASALEDYLKNHVSEKDPVDIKDILASFTMDIIGSCAFGLECNSLKNPNNDFKSYGKRILHPPPLRLFLVILAMTFPKIGRLFGILPNEKDIADFYVRIVNETVDYRIQNNVVRKDFLQLLIDMKKNNEITMDEIVAQCFIFFLGGFETSSTTMTFALYELSRNQEIQDKLRNEINEVYGKCNGELTYDSVMNDMKYMEQVINETLRRYPPLTLLTRVCVSDFKIDDVLIQKGDIVDIPVMAIHYDPEHYDKPDEFYPEHFSEENKAKRHNYAHIPFGEGPRICIGMRFGMLQTKIGLATVLRNYRVTLSDKTKLPIKFHPRLFIPTIEGDLWLNLERV